jgi:hypothetical protein
MPLPSLILLAVLTTSAPLADDVSLVAGEPGPAAVATCMTSWAFPPAVRARRPAVRRSPAPPPPRAARPLIERTPERGNWL